MFNGVWPASVSSGNCQDHERPEGHDDPDACMYMHGLDGFIYLFFLVAPSPGCCKQAA